MLGTENVHAAKTETTSTIDMPGKTTTISVATPTDTSSTIETTTGVKVTEKKKP